MHKNTHCFFKRLNFETVPMEREEVINFIKIRLNYERCAWFRFHLDAALLEFMDGVLVRLNPEYARVRDFDPNKIPKQFENFIMRPVEKVIDVVNQVTIMDLLKFDDEVTDIAADLENIDTYPHGDITPEESVLFVAMKKEAARLSWNLREFCEDEASFHKVDTNWSNLSCMEFARATVHAHEMDFLKRISAYVKHLVSFSEDVLKLKSILGELQRKYGKFESCKVIQTKYNYKDLSRKTTGSSS